MNIRKRILTCLWVINFPLYLENTIEFRGATHKNSNSFSPDEFFIKLKHYLSHNLSNVPNFYRVSLLAMNKYNLNSTLVLLQDNLDDDRNSIYFKWYILSPALYSFESKIFKRTMSKANRKEPTNICISFLNHAYLLISNSIILPLHTEADLGLLQQPRWSPL